LDVDAFLARVADPKTRGQALATLDTLTNPPTDQLLARLTDRRSDVRVAAALALGRIDGPATTDRLIALIAQGQSRREAFIALAASRGDEARAFLQQAAQSENLGGLVRSTLALSELQHSEVQ